MENVLPVLMVHFGILLQVPVIHALIHLFMILTQKNVFAHHQHLLFKIINVLLVQLNKSSTRALKDAKVVHQVLHYF
jgi:hypothetical protein